MEDDVSFEILYKVSTRLARAQIPDVIRDALRTSAMTALLKPDQRVRGIASGDTFRRLVSKTLARQFQSELRMAAFPHNVGLCNHSGTDAAIHSIRYLTDMYPNKVVISIDGVGAFDHVCRKRMFEQLREHVRLRPLIPFVMQWYGSATLYKWVDDEGVSHDIWQGDGGEQGDALMPALFSLALHPALEIIRADLPENAFLIAYLDDIYVVCDSCDAVDCLRCVRNTLSRVCHIDVNLGKLAAWSKHICGPPDGFVEEFGVNAWKANLAEAQRGMKILGSPFGSEQYIEHFFTVVLEEEAQLLNIIPKLPSLQSAWLLLYFCAVPRINHLLASKQ